MKKVVKTCMLLFGRLDCKCLIYRMMFFNVYIFCKTAEKSLQAILAAKKSRDYGNQPLWNGAINKGKSLTFYAKKWFNNVI